MRNTAEAQQARRDLEIARHRPRHGTVRTLSVLPVAMRMLAHPRWRQTAYARLRGIAAQIAQGERALRRAPPQVSERLRKAAA